MVHGRVTDQHKSHLLQILTETVAGVTLPLRQQASVGGFFIAMWALPLHRVMFDLPVSLIVQETVEE